jgi:ATP-dependent exoDNAse (exonuclease V) alpha subunit
MAKTKAFDAGQWGIGRRSERREPAAPPDPEAGELRCTLTGVQPRYVSPDQAFAIWSAEAELEPDAEPAEIVIKGPLARLTPGEMVACKGRWRRHPQHGWSFEVSEYRSALPSNETGVAAWLEARVEGIGPTFAAAIVSHFGAGKVFEVLDADPTRLREVRTAKGRSLPAKQVEKAISAWDDAKAIRQIETFLFSHGVTAGLADRLYRFYGPGVVEILEKTPYRVTELRGVGFRIADRVARSMGVALDDDSRVEAGILYALEEAEAEGHSFLSIKQLIGAAGRALELDEPRVIVEGASRLATKSRLRAEPDEALQQRIYSRRLYNLECRLAREIRELAPAAIRPLIDDPKRPEEGFGGFVPTDEQWSVIEMVRNHRLSLLAGNPGVGKCIRGDQRVIVNGAITAIEEIWKSHHGPEVFDGEGHWSSPTSILEVPVINAAGEMIPAPVERLYRQRVKETGRRVKLQDGSELVMTKRHRVLGPDGWTDEISVGDRVCVPACVPLANTTSVDPDLAYLLAWQISEGDEQSQRLNWGRTADSSTLRITQKDPAVLRRIREAASRFGNRIGLEMGGMRVSKSSCGRTTSMLRICSMPYRRYLEERGYDWGQKSAQKQLPDFLMQADEEAIRTVLGALFAAEGSVIEGLTRAEFCSASPILIEQVSALLRRLGIWMRIRSKRARATNGTKTWRTYFVGTISGPSLRLMAERIEIDDARKQAALLRVAAKHSNANLELIPCNRILSMIKQETGLGYTHFGVNHDYLIEGGKSPSPAVLNRVLGRLDQLIDGSAECAYRKRQKEFVGKQAGHRYERATTEAFEKLDLARIREQRDALAYLQNQQVHYVKVIEVEDVELDCWVYDFEVAEHHNYVAGGICTHNTASVQMVVALLEDAGKQVRLCAPTGKAARRMQELCGHPATTIHRMLEFSPFEGGFQRDESNPIECECLIVDEASMLSLDLAEALFRAIGPDTHVLLVGDPDQLPPVGVGKVFDDLLRCEVVPRVRLTKIFRQAARSMIIQNSRRINQGKLPYLRKEEAEQALGTEMLNDFFWVTRKTPEQTFELMLDFVCNRVPRVFGYDPKTEIMVLAPMRKGAVGLEALNKALEEKLNPGISGKPKRPVVPKREICVGSRIVQTKNDHTREIMNGELAIVKAFDETKGECLLSLDDGEREEWIPTTDMETFHLAWAMSIHKAQGSQWPCVVVGCSTAHYTMLTRSLIYTAVTRASKLCVMSGERKALQLAVDKVDMRRRNSTLAARIVDPALSGELF